MIPKIIHYCWFGGRKKNRIIKKCIKTWPKELPEFKIIERNESNYDINQAPKYVQDAYSKKKYAFVSDYVRLDVLSKYGGVYLDTDIKIFKNFGCLLNADLVLCFESNIVMTAFIASSRNNSIIESFKNMYNTLVFEKDKNVGYIPNTFLFTNFLVEHYGLSKNGLTQKNDNFNYIVYANEFLCGYDIRHNHTKITKNTYTVHLYENSWGKSFKGIILRLIPRLIGFKIYDRLYDYYKQKHPKHNKWDDL